MSDRKVVDQLLAQLLGPHLGHIPLVWPRRIYEIVDRMASSAGRDPATWLMRLLGTPPAGALGALVDAATIGHTSFFRHPDQLDELRRMLPRYAADQTPPVRIWCAGCSTGEEPYSVALAAEQAGVEVEILATDVSPAAIHAARTGVYSSERLGKMPGESSAKAWTPPASLRRMVRFEVASLVGASPALAEGPFDVIFCRNVLIYFDREAVANVLANLAEHLRPRGAIVVSPADAVMPLPDCLSRGTAVGWLYPSRRPLVPSQQPASFGRPSMRVRASMAGVPIAIDEPPVDRAARLLGSGQGIEAESILATLLNATPDHIAGWFLLGEALLQRGERSQARAAFLRASRCNPKASTEVDGEALRGAAVRRAEALDEMPRS